MSTKNSGYLEEYGAGVIVFSHDLEFVLIVESKWKNNFGFPKGRQDINIDGYNWKMTALRELYEETSLTKKTRNTAESHTNDLLFLKDCLPGKRKNNDSTQRFKNHYLISIDNTSTGNTSTGEKYTFHVKYAIAKCTQTDMSILEKNVKCDNPTEILSIKWMSIQEAFEILDTKRRALLEKAIDLTKLFRFFYW